MSVRKICGLRMCAGMHVCSLCLGIHSHMQVDTLHGTHACIHVDTYKRARRYAYMTCIHVHLRMIIWM